MNENTQIILMPMSVPALFAYHVLKRNGYNVVAFGDNDPEKHNIEYDGIPIYSPEVCIRAYEHAVVMSCLIVRDAELKRQLASFENVKFIPYSLVFDLDPSLTSLSDINISKDISPLRSVSNLMPSAELRVRQQYVPHHILGIHNPFVIPQFHISVTHRCNLKCRDCCQMMQYYPPGDAKDCDLEATFHAIDVIMKAVDWIALLPLLGGEPLVYKQLAEILDYLGLRYRDKIGVLQIITNGTIVPNDALIASLRKNDGEIYISDYGKHSCNVKKIKEVAKENNIRCYAPQIEHWVIANKIVDGATRDSADTQSSFDRCTERTWRTIWGNKLFGCVVLPNLYELHAVPDMSENYLDLSKGASPDEIRKFIESISALPACRYCLGDAPSYRGEPVPPAIQTEKSLPYRKY